MEIELTAPYAAYVVYSGNNFRMERKYFQAIIFSSFFIITFAP